MSPLILLDFHFFYNLATICATGVIKKLSLTGRPLFQESKKKSHAILSSLEKVIVSSLKIA